MTSKDVLFSAAKEAVSKAALHDGEYVDGVTQTGRHTATIRVCDRRGPSRYFQVKISEVM